MIAGYVRRDLAVWLLPALAETLHGTLRTVFLKPVVGDLRSRRIGVGTGSVITFVIATATSRWIGATGTRPLLAIGPLWTILMVSFEATVGKAAGGSWRRIRSDYLPWEGGFMIGGMTTLALSPLLAANLRGSRSRDA